MNKRLAVTGFLAGADYSLADVATYPWTVPQQRELHAIDIDEFSIKRYRFEVNPENVLQGRASARINGFGNASKLSHFLLAFKSQPARIAPIIEFKPYLACLQYDLLFS